MNSNYKNCVSDDLDYIKRREELLQKNKEVFKQTLNCLLDTATMIPVCEEEYRKDAPSFRKYEDVYEMLRETMNSMNAYGITLKLPELIEDKLSKSR